MTSVAFQLAWSGHAERVLGYVLPGVQSVYNSHGYRNEKA
jgi:hypothetical protein